MLTIASTGAATLSSTINSGVITITNSSVSGVGLYLDGTAYSGHKWAIGDGITTNTTFSIKDITSGVEGFKLTSAGAATFSSSVTANGGRYTVQGTNQNAVLFNQNAGGTSTGYLVGRSYSSDDANDFFIYNVATATRVLAIASTGAATFSNSVTATTGLTVGSLGSGSDAIITLATNASGSPRTIYYKASTATINFTGTGGTDLMTLTNGGNVGIGTTSPGSKLSIVGLPTSSAGLSSGDIYVAAGVLMIV